MTPSRVSRPERQCEECGVKPARLYKSGVFGIKKDLCESCIDPEVDGDNDWQSQTEASDVGSDTTVIPGSASPVASSVFGRPSPTASESSTSRAKSPANPPEALAPPQPAPADPVPAMKRIQRATITNITPCVLCQKTRSPRWYTHLIYEHKHEDGSKYCETCYGTDYNRKKAAEKKARTAEGLRAVQPAPAPAVQRQAFQAQASPAQNFQRQAQLSQATHDEAMRAQAQNQQFQFQAKEYVARRFTCSAVQGPIFLVRGLQGGEAQLVHAVPTGISYYAVSQEVELSYNVVPLDCSPVPGLLAQNAAATYGGSCGNGGGYAPQTPIMPRCPGPQFAAPATPMSPYASYPPQGCVLPQYNQQYDSQHQPEYNQRYNAQYNPHNDPRQNIHEHNSSGYLQNFHDEQFNRQNMNANGQNFNGCSEYSNEQHYNGQN